jgi:putative oxidoreductase
MAMIENSLARLRPHLLALLRIVTALLFLQHGLSKLVGFPNPGQKQSSYFTLLGLAAVIEVVGSVLLVVGFRTRLVAFILSGEMAVAYFKAHAPRGFYPITNGGEAAILFCFVFLYIACAGGGGWTVDRR